jgi:acyl-CoA dehydrogenase
MSSILYLLIGLTMVIALGYRDAGPRWWLGAALAWTLGWSAWLSWSAVAVAVLVVGAVGWVLVQPGLRRRHVSDRILRVFRRIMPAMSQTESEAINAGTVWWDAQLFSGKPDWAKLFNAPKPGLSAEEQAFLDDETEQLCAIANEWDIMRGGRDLPPAVWQFIKDKGFLGMIIPKRYGGKGFSAYAHSQVVHKLSTRSSTAAVSVMVPNSLGPAELLLHYGTEEQRNHYLPRLARGEEIPCFGLTNPHAGSDAAAIPDVGVVCRGPWEGAEILGMRVTWEKRYITLGPIATLLGLAFRLRDPQRLLGGEEDLGITCALVPTDTPGVHIGRRHMPLHASFQNGPNWGADVFMPLDWIIGGPKMAGQGWRMLMECLAAGRSISLPSSSTGVSKLAVRGTGAYARVRRQFKTAIGRFEGIEEALARMGGNLYAMDAVRKVTAAAVDAGERPSVVSAIAKYHCTERARSVVNDAMDIQGGKGICLGPRNFIGIAYQQVPIAITVEGANILTRSLIIFGQGAIRCHPFVLAELNAAREVDAGKASADFDAAFWGHVRFLVRNAARTLVHGLSAGALLNGPAEADPILRRDYARIERLSAAFAFLADVSMLVFGASLKRRERISARLGDILAQLYFASCVLKRYDDEGRQGADLPFVNWAVADALHAAQTAFDGVLENYRSALLGAVLRRMIFPYGRTERRPSDRIGTAIARVLTEPGPVRDRLTADLYLPRGTDHIIAGLEAALTATVAAEAIESRIRGALRDRRIDGADDAGIRRAALAAAIITPAEEAVLEQAARWREEVIAVDHFAQDFSQDDRQAQPPVRAVS